MDVLGLSLDQPPVLFKAVNQFGLSTLDSIIPDVKFKP
jgi:hypothetical protein